MADKDQTATLKQSITNKYKPREPRGKKQFQVNKPKEDNTKEKDDIQPQDEAQSKRKHEKLLRGGKRIKEYQEAPDTKKSIQKLKASTSKGVQEKNKYKLVEDKVRKENECGKLTKKDKILEEKCLRLEDLKRPNKNKESKVEKCYHTNLSYTVFHKMEVEVDQRKHKVNTEPESVIEFKYHKFEDVEDQIKEKERDILELMHKVFQLYKPDEILLSFNGGKDCTVVLHMLNKFFQSNPCLKHIKIPTLYITDPNAFEEIDQFVEDCEKLYNIEVIKKKGPIKEALKLVCEENKKLKAVFMGCRRSDPYCKDLKIMQMTDPGWPQLMRINPIIDWKCRQVWEYIYLYNVPYCILYQKGYTSIGNKNNTKPNPYLRLINANTGQVTDYRPGHELLDNDELERAGRF